MRKSPLIACLRRQEHLQPARELIVKRLAAVFEQDWAITESGKEAAKVEAKVESKADAPVAELAGAKA